MSGEMAKNKAYSNNEKLSKKQFVSTYGSLIELIFLLVQSWDVQVCILHILHSLSKDIKRSWQF